MKKEIIDIPEVNLSDVKEFWVLGSQYKDGILGEYNLKIDVKAAVNGGGSGENEGEGEQGIKWVDLGLPSGTLWADRNIGATSETDYGDYFMYGRSDKIVDYAAEVNVPYDSAGSETLYGGLYPAPDVSLLQELLDNTTLQETVKNGVTGAELTGINGNSIFIPLAGMYNSAAAEGEKFSDGYATLMSGTANPYVNSLVIGPHWNTGILNGVIEMHYDIDGYTVRPAKSNSII